MKITTSILLFFFVISNATIVFAKNDENYQFRYKFKDEQYFRNVIHMHITTSASGNEKSFDLELKEKITIKKKKDNNFIFTVENESIDSDSGIEKSGFHLNNMNIMEKGQKLVLKIKENGKIVKYISKPFKAYQYSRLFELPEKKISTGEYFKKNQTVNGNHISKTTPMGFISFKISKYLDKIVDGKMAYFSNKLKIENSSKNSNLDFTQKIIFDMEKGYIIKGKIKTNTSQVTNDIKTKADVEVDWECFEILPTPKKKKYDL